MTDRDEIADYQWLTGEHAARWLTHLAVEQRPLHIWAANLRQHLSAFRTHLIMQQVELRQRARTKFEMAQRMFFTPIALEQCTDQWIAAYKAQRFAGVDRIADLCCGIGGDLLALMHEGRVNAVDHDAAAMILARANVHAVFGNSAASKTILQKLDVQRWQSSDVEALHVDPDRRATGRRTSHLETSSPSLSALQRLLRMHANMAVKLAPAGGIPPNWDDRCELEWISRDGECKQLVAWHGSLAQRPGCRRATIVAAVPAAGDESMGPRSTGHNNASTFAVVASAFGAANMPIPAADRLYRYVFEPDPAILAAGLNGAVAARHGLAAVAPRAVYLTSDNVPADQTLTCFEVLDTLPFDRRKLHQYLSCRKVGRLEIKYRNLRLAPEQLRRQLKLKGDRQATLMVTPVGNRIQAVIARRKKRR